MRIIIIISSILQCLTMWTEVVLVVTRRERRFCALRQLKKTVVTKHPVKAALTYSS